MANDNTLGAPTEGLGQTVTFAAEGGRTPQMQPVLRQSMRNSSTGGGATRTAQALQVPEAKQDATFAVLAKLGGDLLKPHLEAERTAMYMQGMQKAAQGQAITEIVDEQPWYSKLFGSTSLVDGARAYTASAKATALAVDFEQKLPEYRKLSANEFADVATKALLSAATGDAATDMLVQAEVAKTFPSMMKNQAKAHLRYQQEVLETSITDNATAAFAALGQQDAAARTPGSTTEAGDVLGVGMRALDVFVKPAEMDQKVHDKLIANSAVGAIGNGNFAVFELLESSGKLSQMDADSQYQIRRAKDQASSRARVNLPPEFAVKLADFKTLSMLPDTTDESIVASAQKINSEYTMATGDPSPLIPVSTTAGEIAQYRVAEAQRLKAAESERDRAKSAAAKAEAGANFIQGHAANAVADPSYYMGGLKPADRQDVFNHIRAASPQNHMSVVVRQAAFDVKDKVLEDTLQGGVSHALQEGKPDMLDAAYRIYRQIKDASGDDSVVAQQYAGRHGDLLLRYDAIAQGRQLSATEMAVAYGEATRPAPKAPSDSKKLKAVTKELTSGYTMSAISALGLRDTQPIVNPEGLAVLLAPKLKDGLPVEEAIELAKRQSPELSVLGGHYWTRGKNDTSVEQYLFNNPKVYGIASDNINRGIKHSIDKYTEEAGIDSGLTIGQVLDTPNGVPQMYVMGTGTDGKVKMRLFTADDINNNWIEAKKPNPKAGSFGPPITYTPAPNAPSIYASPEEWKAYREWQATQK